VEGETAATPERAAPDAELLKPQGQGKRHPLRTRPGALSQQVRAVFDTNILVSALVLPSGRAAEALARIVDGGDRLLLSKPILDELLGVLARKFSRDREELARVAVWLEELAEWVRPTRRITVAADEPDNRVLECASAGRADAIVTGDKALLQLRNFEGVSILTLRDYLAK
jgi:uncharacterized protein